MKDTKKSKKGAVSYQKPGKLIQFPAGLTRKALRSLIKKRVEELREGDPSEAMRALQQWEGELQQANNSWFEQKLVDSALDVDVRTELIKLWLTEIHSTETTREASHRCESGRDPWVTTLSFPARAAGLVGDWRKLRRMLGMLEAEKTEWFVEQFRTDLEHLELGRPATTGRPCWSRDPRDGSIVVMRIEARQIEAGRGASGAPNH